MNFRAGRGVPSHRIFLLGCLLVLCASFQSPAVFSQAGAAPDAKKLYEDLRSFKLGGGSVQVENLSFQRDRARMTFVSGTIYFATPVAGRVEGAVFIGTGNFKAEPPPVKFEQENVKRRMKADDVESDFKVAVLRFTDDAFEVLGKNVKPGEAPPDAQKQASEFEGRMLNVSGANTAARLAVSILNKQTPGFFLADFDKGKRGHFTFLFDPQGRVPSDIFEVNGGEKGLIIGWDFTNFGSGDWMAFYSQADYEQKHVDFSDSFDEVSILHHDMDIDLREVGKRLRFDDKLTFETRLDGLRAIQFQVNQGLTREYWAKYAERLTYVKSQDGAAMDAVQAEGDDIVTVFFPQALPRGQKLELDFRFEGDGLTMNENSASADACFFPLLQDWYPLQGYLQRSSYHTVFHHTKRYTPVTLGERGKDQQGSGSDITTEWQMNTPIPFYSFAIGDYKPYATTAKVKDASVPVEYYELAGGLAPVQADFVAAEIGNALRYYSLLYGPYPYPTMRAVYNYRSYGQGFAGFLLLAGAQQSEKFTYSFISHEVGHQWWGDSVSWRSYRDQWLSEAFAEYSAVLYTGQRAGAAARQDLISRKRDELRGAANIRDVHGTGRIADVGPLIMGGRLPYYTALTYDKGSLVLRMLHFLFTDPITQDDKPFFQMMADFVHEYDGKAASTEDFAAIASRHFSDTAISKKYHVADLNWFFQQWVYSAELPSYRLEYQLAKQPDGTVMLTGTLYQDDIPPESKWFMPLPIVLTYGKDKAARGTVAALGPKTLINIKLPSMPDKVELDPELFILSAKTSVEKGH
jgi:hypothetical protein